jgi:glutamate synthase domain-containing protein 1/formylmethanofuran dehydrogenase subunit C
MCGILGLYSMDGRDLPAELVLRGLDAMKERGTPHGSGVALYRPVGVPRVKAFSERPAEDGLSIQIPGGLYDLTFFGSPVNVEGMVYLNSRWLDVYKAVGWPRDIDSMYDLRSLSSSAWLGHTRYPTNSPGRYPYYSHPFTAGDFAIVHNGDLSSYGSNVNLLTYRMGYRGFTGNDSEAIAFLLKELSERLGVEGAIRELMYGEEFRWARLDGPYAVAFLAGGPTPVFGAFVDPQHFRPLYVGISGDVIAVASEAAAIRAILGDAMYWALRGGEYLIAEGDDLHGNFRRRYSYPSYVPSPPARAVDASRFSAVDLAPHLRGILEGGVGGCEGNAGMGPGPEVDVVNVQGHRYIGNGMDRGVLRIWGVVGNASANVMSGGTIHVYGDVQDDFGDAMNGGAAFIHGNAGDTLGQAKRGGSIYVYGDAGNRAGIQQRGGAIVIGGSVGDYAGEYMGGGIMVVLRATGEDDVGFRIGSGMVGGRIYVRGRIPRERIGRIMRRDALERYLRSLLEDGALDEAAYERAVAGDLSQLSRAARRVLVGVNPLSVEYRRLGEGELREVVPHLREFEGAFGVSVDASEEFTVIAPAAGRESEEPSVGE